MTWMEVTMQPSKQFIQLKNAIAAEFGESASDNFLPHCSLLYFPHKDPSCRLASESLDTTDMFGINEACKLVEDFPEMVDHQSQYKAIEILLVETGWPMCHPRYDPTGWPTNIVHRIDLRK